MFESKLVLVLNPQLLDRFEEDKTTEEMVNKAVQKGYKLSDKTPTFLFKYPAIIDLVISSSININFLVDNFDTIMSCESRRKAVAEYYAKFFAETEKVIDSKYFIDLIEPKPEFARFIQLRLKGEYLKSHPDYVYSEEFNLDNYIINEDFIKTLKDINIDFARVKNINVGLEEWKELLLFSFPEILKVERFAYDLTSYSTKKMIVKGIEEGIFSYENFSDLLLRDKEILKPLVVKNPSLLDEYPMMREGITDETFIDAFVDGLPESLDELEKVSEFCSNYRLSDEHMSIIKNAIIDSDYLINDVYWPFIYCDKELMMNQFRRNPDIINTCPNFLSGCMELVDSDYLEILDILKESKVELYTYHVFFEHNQELFKYVLSNYPNLLMNFGYYKRSFSQFHDEPEIFDLLNSLPITPASNPYGANFDANIVDEIRKNPFNYFALHNAYGKSYEFDAFVALLESGIDLYDKIASPTISDTDISMVMKLQKGLDTIRERSFSSSFNKEPSYPLYVITNYPDKIIKEERDADFSISVPSSDKKTGPFIKPNQLLEDFSNFFRLEPNLSEEELQEVCRLFYANRDKIKFVFESVYRSPYIFIHEFLLNNNTKVPLIGLNDAQIEYFNDLFKKNNLELTNENILYIRDVDLIVEGIKKGIVSQSLLLHDMDVKQKELVISLIKENFVNGKITLEYLPYEFTVEAYEFCKDKIDAFTLYHMVMYYCGHFSREKISEILRDFIQNYSFAIDYKALDYLSFQDLKDIIPNNVELIKFISSHPDKFIGEIYDLALQCGSKFVDINYSRDVDYTPQDLENIYEQNKTNLRIFKYLYDIKKLSLEEYKKYYLMCIENIKSSKYCFDSLIDFDADLDVPYDSELVDFLLNSSMTALIDYFKAYKNKNYDVIIAFILNNIDKFDSSINKLFNVLNIDDIEMIVNKYPKYLTSELFNCLYYYYSDKDVDPSFIYEYWVKTGKPLESSRILNNSLIFEDVVNNGLLLDVFIRRQEDYSPLCLKNIYEYYKKNNCDITSSRLFYTNPLILLDYVGESIPNPIPTRLPDQKVFDIYLKIIENNPEFLNNIYTQYGLWNQFFRNAIKTDPVKMMNLLSFDNPFISEITNILKEKDFVYSLDCPLVYLNSSKAMVDILSNNPETIDVVIDIIRKNNISLDQELTDLVSKVVVEQNKFEYCKYVVKVDLHDFVMDALNSDINNLHKLDGVNLDSILIRDIVVLVLDKIRKGEYTPNSNTPEFLYYNDEIRKIAMSINPDLIKGVRLSKLDFARDYSLIEKAIENPKDIDELFKGVIRNYPEELVDQLVDKLISNNYQINNNTPRFLLCNCMFIYQMLKQGINIDDTYLHNFVTFENYYKLKDKELFVDLINKGYGLEFKNYIMKFGLDKTLEMAEKYGYLLNMVDINKVKREEDLILSLGGEVLSIDFFLRTPDLNGALKKLNGEHRYSSSAEAILIRVLLKDKEKNIDKIADLIKSGYSYSFDNEMTNLFMNDFELFELFIENTPDLAKLSYAIAKCNPELLTEKNILIAIKNGYEICDSTPEIIRKNSKYVNLILKTCKHEETVYKIVDTYKDIALDEEAIMLLANSRYKLSEKTPDAILTNLSFLVHYFNKQSYSFKNDMLLVNNNLYKDLLDAIDINKFILYFNEGYDADKFKELEEKFYKHAFHKKDILVNMLIMGKKLSPSIRKSFEEAIFENFEEIELDGLERLINCLIRIEYSNSGEIRQFADTLVKEIIKRDDFEEVFNKIENIFLHDSLPMVKKLFLVFKTLHKDYSSFSSDRISVVLKNSSDEEKDKIIYDDLVKSAFRSNNRSILEFLKELDSVSSIIESFENDKSSVSDDDLRSAMMFFLSIIDSKDIMQKKDYAVYNNNYDKLLLMIREEFGQGDLRDIVVQDMFNISGYETALSYLESFAKRADTENRMRASQPFTLEVGDFVKGVDKVDYLSNIFQNGSVAREFLGDSAGSDLTPLDTDLSRINIVGSTISETIESTAANGYGSVIFVLKAGDMFSITREKDKDDYTDVREFDKLEAFYTGKCDTLTSDHFGIRTGFSSGEIDYIVATDSRVKLEVALGGIYIPIVDREGKLIFTPDEYDKLREKMSGLEHYGVGTFSMADYEDLVSDGILSMANGVQENRKSIQAKHEKIKESVSLGMKNVGITMKDRIDGNLSNGYADLIDTGSTARGTDLAGKADFDYICRVDRELFLDKERFVEFKKSILEQFESITKAEFADDAGHFRLKGVKVKGLDELVDIDISFVIRTTKLSLSSDESLLVKLEAIENGNYTTKGDERLADGKDARDLVTGNILMAKKLFKSYTCYKNRRNPDTPQGGLGGIGIENWILQHGGSLKKAAESFTECARRYPDFFDFREHYQVWDFGQNHYSFEKNNYSHDNFVYGNMDYQGFEKMKRALENYLKFGEKAFEEPLLGDSLADAQVAIDQITKEIEEKKKSIGM